MAACEQDCSLFVLTRLVAGPPHIDPTQLEVGRQRRDVFNSRIFQTSVIEFHCSY